MAIVPAPNWCPVCGKRPNNPTALFCTDAEFHAELHSRVERRADGHDIGVETIGADMVAIHFKCGSCRVISRLDAEALLALLQSTIEGYTD